MIENAIHTLLKQPIRVIGAGRTDAGVHALGQTAHIQLEHPLDCEKVLHHLNGILPHDIRIKELAPTLNDFHAQYSAQSKEYHYHLWLEKVIDPFVRPYRHHFSDTRFSLPLLQEGVQPFIGTHDFATFANVGGSVKTTVRTIDHIQVVEQEGGIRLEFRGDGFLYKMVRNIVGTLLELSTNRRPLSQISELFAAKDRRAAGRAAPPRGLFLIKIHYPSRFLKSSTKEGKCEKFPFTLNSAGVR